MKGVGAALPAGDFSQVAYLGLGGNVGHRDRHLSRALFALATHPEISVTRVSRLYESQYVGPGSQADFLNACVRINTRLAPRVLLAVLKSLEQRHGREMAGHMRPRPLDLDILLMDGIIAFDPDLTLPHPRLRERLFVLAPLAEIAPDLEFPDSCETVAAACAKIRRKAGPWVRPWSERSGWPARGRETQEDWRAALAIHCR